MLEVIILLKGRPLVQLQLFEHNAFKDTALELLLKTGLWSTAFKPFSLICLSALFQQTYLEVYYQTNFVLMVFFGWQRFFSTLKHYTIKF